ncbi:MAG: hypothetical protein ACQETL_02345 [Bacteroidota bacterium]
MRNKILHSHRKIFLIDGVGALLTTLIIGIVFTNFQEYIGMPREILISLAIIALGFFIYSLSCFLILKKNWKPFLKVIVIANLVYCIITTVLIILFFHQLTLLGLLYFIGEIIVIGVLVYFEFLILIRRGNS